LSLRIRPLANLRIKPLLRKECSLDRNCNRQASKIAERVLVLCSRHPQPPPQLVQNLLLTPVYSLAADSPLPGQIAPGHMESDRVSGFFSEAPGEGEIQDHTRPLSARRSRRLFYAPYSRNAGKPRIGTQKPSRTRRILGVSTAAKAELGVIERSSSPKPHSSLILCCAYPRIDSIKKDKIPT